MVQVLHHETNSIIAGLNKISLQFSVMLTAANGRKWTGGSGYVKNCQRVEVLKNFCRSHLSQQPEFLNISHSVNIVCENRHITFPSGHHAKLGKVSQLYFSAKVSQSDYTNLTANEGSRQWLVCAKTAEEMEKTNEKHLKKELVKQYLL